MPNNFCEKPSVAVQAMVDGLRRRWTMVNMGTFGMALDGVCYGCAATNTICQLAGKAMTTDDVANVYSRADFANLYTGDLDTFEEAINSLRVGHIIGFEIEWNYFAETDYNLPDATLPRLEDDYTEEQLLIFENYAQLLRDKGM